MGPKQRAIAALSRPKPRGKRIVPVTRDKELRAALLEVAKVCKKHGIRLTAMEPWDSIAVVDTRHERPSKWPIAAYVGGIGDGRLKDLKLQSIMPDWDRYKTLPSLVGKEPRRRPAERRYDGNQMKTDPETQARMQAETIAAISARCEGPNQFENFDRAFRHSLTVSKDAVLKEEARLKKSRARQRAKKSA